MTQLTQGSDLEERLRKDLDDWAVRHMIQVPARAMQQGCDEELRAIIEAYKQRSIDRANVIAMLLAKWNAYEELLLNESIKPTRRKEIEAKAAEYRKAYQDRIAELVQQLSPTTTEDNENV